MSLSVIDSFVGTPGVSIVNHTPDNDPQETWESGSQGRIHASGRGIDCSIEGLSGYIKVNALPNPGWIEVDYYAPTKNTRLASSTCGSVSLTYTDTYADGIGMYLAANPTTSIGVGAQVRSFEPSFLGLNTTKSPYSPQIKRPEFDFAKTIDDDWQICSVRSSWQPGGNHTAKIYLSGTRLYIYQDGQLQTYVNTDISSLPPTTMDFEVLSAHQSKLTDTNNIYIRLSIPIQNVIVTQLRSFGFWNEKAFIGQEEIVATA